MSAKRKLQKFEQNKTFPHFFEPQLYYNNFSDFELKAKWHSEFFKNSNPIILELGCGKGEYSVNIATMFPEKNCIGVDIKGARMWKGASESLKMGLKNIAFLRTRVEFTPLCFGKDEISEIWLTFPDPQLGPKKRIKKRLTSSVFLSKYQKFLKNNGIINLKTDDDTLYKYTLRIIQANNLELLVNTDDLYNSSYYQGLLAIKTHYESLWNKENRIIKYLKFRLPYNVEIIEPEYEEE
ncbi:MAG: tRNA (guanosine(46)-N7)-methyltransferase TrmB [Bacteroidales bacterium]|jgi:tRNA (guanine-N7-)-methyltransferase|nr:tRNA (guanosine(46)-N7)-methyltransferase TrmB [Bacteroidales bacterium]HOL98734.1 tRNA (guanosine(46)-N7)-methyltransferase TrmB [Bacteroidales bacterium]HOM36175.1 tRNA (guanosine(46)-N7)-methyltransferase TrmB [Bacteroidales bacterium]HPD23491.1 tRNA (guanosine(46)-N7)-methyltransferase TrmB [Bacteroidales bacterium]HRS99623.1 tRNA (guanosine(46)-N7)-methyltransferase TrmB [Bacteroidales bacterium]